MTPPMERNRFDAPAGRGRIGEPPRAGKRPGGGPPGNRGGERAAATPSPPGGIPRAPGEVRAPMGAGARFPDALPRRLRRGTPAAPTPPKKDQIQCLH